jgi:hypothetical protein
MDDNDELCKRTSRAAVRLLKSRIREYIYTTKNNEASEGDTRWSALLLVEKTFSGPALREWQEVISLWLPLDEVRVNQLTQLVRDSFAPAASEVLATYDEDQVNLIRRLVETYHRSFMPEGLVHP